MNLYEQERQNQQKHRISVLYKYAKLLLLEMNSHEQAELIENGVKVANFSVSIDYYGNCYLLEGEHIRQEGINPVFAIEMMVTMYLTDMVARKMKMLSKETGDNISAEYYGIK